MLIEIHIIQNHSPANLNRDDLGAPKTCHFGGVLRSRISSQCIKRSIRTSESFKLLCGGVRTRQLAKIIAERVGGDSEVSDRVLGILALCGIKPKDAKKGGKDEDKSAGLVYTTREGVARMAEIVKSGAKKSDKSLAAEFANIIAGDRFVPDMALCGRMLEPKKAKKSSGGEAEEPEEDESEGKGKGVWKGLDLSVEAALQVAHAISTHEARPEIDYYVAADDIPGDDAGAGYVDEAMFSSACFYKFFSIHWEKLVENLNGNEALAAHTVGAFIRGAALTNPTGKQNSFAAHNPPDGILVEIKDTPISYANAFAKPVSVDGGRDVISQSIAQLGQYVHDLDTGYSAPEKRFWFSPNLRYPLCLVENEKEIPISTDNVKSLDELVKKVVGAIGYDWSKVSECVLSAEEAP